MPKCAAKLAKAKGLFSDFVSQLCMPFTGKIHCVPPHALLPFKTCIVVCRFRVLEHEGVIRVEGCGKGPDAYTVVLVPPATMNMIDLCGHSPAWTSLIVTTT
jgi:hypothetical protein